MPFTVAVPTVAPVLLAQLGAVVCGPTIHTVMVPVAVALAPDSVAENALPGIDVLAVPVLGPVSVSVGEIDVEVMPLPHALAAELSLVSPL